MFSLILLLLMLSPVVVQVVIQGVGHLLGRVPRVGLELTAAQLRSGHGGPCTAVTTTTIVVIVTLCGLSLVNKALTYFDHTATP